MRKSPAVCDERAILRIRCSLCKPFADRCRLPAGVQCRQCGEANQTGKRMRFYLLFLPLCLLTVNPVRAEADREQLKQAFDGAMTCAAIAQLWAEQKPRPEKQQWENRSYAFSMFALQYYTQATGKPVTMKELGGMLTEYFNAMLSWSMLDMEPYETGCREKYGLMDQMCAANGCLHAVDQAGQVVPAEPAAVESEDAAPESLKPGEDP
jgi:hypothetical protein